MQNETINPVRHSTLGTVSGTTLGAVGGGLKSGAKTLGYLAIGGAVIGGLIGAGVFGAVGVGGWAIAQTLAGVVGGGLVGGLAGLFAAPIAGGIGAVTGGSRAATRIREEKGAANMLDAQLSAYQAQALASQQATTIYAPTAANNNYPSASTMNQAGSQIQAATAQDLGTINGMQLQRA